MKRRRIPAAIATALFLVVAPGGVAGLGPWLLSDWRMAAPFFGVAALRWLGGALILAGVAILLESFARFVREGAGTPAPIYPTDRLIVTGLYRHVRNPMYVGVAAVIFGQALLLGRAGLLLYGAVVCLGFHLFVRFYEEPSLERRYGAQFAAYRAGVRRWLPRLAPWHDAA
jgi:protein-S-isoprenylcysteine O-methyltransferase Ste14